MRKLNPHNRRVVVTGLGVVSSLGIGWEEFWKNLLAGKSGISPIESFDTSQYDRHYGGEVKNFDPIKFMTKRRAASIGRSSQMAIAASKLAIRDAGLNLKPKVRQRMGICIGMTMAEMQLLEAFDDTQLAHKNRNFSRHFSSMFPCNSVSSNVAIELGLEGYNRSLSTACAAGNYSIGNVYDLIKSGKIDYGLAGGADSFSRVVFTGFCLLHAVTPEKCQPFDKNRQGMIPAEGAGVLFLESMETAEKRGAHIYAEILGYGLSCDAKHMTDPSPAGIAKTLQKALINSGVSRDQIDYICAHGTGTIENDAAECQAINWVFRDSQGEAYAKPVSSIKSMIGHTMGAASAFGGIACCLAIKDAQIPPTINHEHDDPDCIIDCVPNVSRKHKIKVAVNNSQAFGGNNACLILKG